MANIPSFEITILTISSKAIENNGAIKIESSRQNRIMRESTKPGTSKRSKRNSEDIKKGIHINNLLAKSRKVKYNRINLIIDAGRKV